MLRLLKLLFIGPEGLVQRVERVENEWRATKLDLENLFDKVYRQAQRLARREERGPQQPDAGTISPLNGPGPLPPQILARRARRLP